MVAFGHHRMCRLQVGTLFAGSLTLSLLAVVFGSRFSDLFCAVAAVVAVAAAGLAGAIWGRVCSESSVQIPPVCRTTGQDVADAPASEHMGPDLVADLQNLTRNTVHDLKSPLVTAQGFLQLLNADLSQDQQDSVAEHLETIGRVVTLMERRLDKLLEVARSGESQVGRTSLEVAELVQPALDAVAVMIRQRNAHIDAAAGFPVIHGDRERLISVYQNLIENALKYVPESRTPEIEVSWRKSGTDVVYFVKDNGPGIDPALHQQAFTVFETLGAKQSGSGIGLAIVQRAIDAHQGRVWIESAGDSTGTTVCFCVPPPPSEPAID